MAFTYLLGKDAATDGESIWWLKEQLKNGASWVVSGSGTGTSGVGGLGIDEWDPGTGVYLGTADHTLSWICIQKELGTGPSFLFQRVSEGVWRAWYSAEDGFTGGAADEDTRPTATDEVDLMNSPAGTNAWLPANASYVIDVIVGDADENFSFFFGARLKSEGMFCSTIFYDGVTESAAGDVDPYVIGVQHSTDAARGFLETSKAFAATSASQTVGCTRGWFKKNDGAEAFVPYPAVVYGAKEATNDLLVPRGTYGSTDPMNLLEDLPVYYWRGGATHATQQGRKGKSSLFRYSNQKFADLRPRPYREYDRMLFGAFSIPWDGLTFIRV